MRLAERSVASFRAHGRNIVFRAGAGPFVEDDAGSRYVDLVCGYGPVIVGHADAEFQARVGELLSAGLHLPGYSVLHEEYARSLPAMGPHSAAAIFKTSSEAVSAALRLAALRTSKLGIIRCGFLGWHDSQLAPDIGWHEDLESALRRRPAHRAIFRGVSGSETTVDWTDLRWETFGELCAEFRTHIGAAAIDVFQEDLTSAGLVKEFVARCEAESLVSIVDETKSAGRVAPLGISEILGLQPDFLILGKAIANGAPLSVLVIREFSADEFKAVRVGGTYSKERFGVAAAMATTSIMEDRDGYAAIRTEAARFCRLLNDSAARAGISELVTAVTCLDGTALNIRMRDNVRDDRQHRERLRSALQEAGILLLIGHPSFVSLAHHQVDEDWFCSMATRALLEWARHVQ